MVQLFTPGSLFSDCVCEETDRTLTGSGNGWSVQTEGWELSFIEKPPSVPHKEGSGAGMGREAL